MFENITNICRYNSAYELLQEFCGLEFWSEIDAEDDIFLRHFDDFEGFCYYCINGETIIVTDFLGTVIGNPMTFLEFLREIEDQLAADREDR